MLYSPVVHPTFDDGCESSSALLEKVFGPLAQLVECCLTQYAATPALRQKIIGGLHRRQIQPASQFVISLAFFEPPLALFVLLTHFAFDALEPIASVVGYCAAQFVPLLYPTAFEIIEVRNLAVEN